MKLLTTKPTPPSVRLLATSLALALAGGYAAHATPYASQLVNVDYNNRTMQFWVNEGGGNVTITYEDNSVDPNWNGVTSGTNVAAGAHTFNVPPNHSSYTISVYKIGTGSPSLIATSPAFTPRGVEVNKNFGSTNFGKVYVSYSNGSGIGAFNPDMTSIYGGAKKPTGGGCSWFGGGFSPYKIFIADDDYLMVGDASIDYGTSVTGALQNDGVWRVDPSLTTSQLFLGPRGASAGIAGTGFGPIHSSVESRPVVIGNPSTGPVTLVTVDGDYSWANGYNSMLVYKNVSLNTMPWTNPPDIQGPAVGLPLSAQSLGGNPYPALQFYGNYIYSGTYRDNYAYPCVQVYTNDIGRGDTLAKVWDSITGIGGVVGTGPDLFHQTVGGIDHGTVDVAVSPDGRFCVAQSIDNWFVIAYMTNGIPDASRVFNNIPTSYTGNGRGIAFDAAGNVYSSSSGIGNVQEWSLGLTATTITSGTTNGSTGFNVVTPNTEVTVTATTALASQGGANGAGGTPVPGVFTISRTGNIASSLPVTFTLSGTATSGVYTAQSGITLPTSTTVPATNTITIPAGQASVTVTITPTTANVPRPTTTVTLNLMAGANYITALPFSDTVAIQNTSSQLLFVAPRAPTMYKAFASDFASVTVTRWGDTNVSYAVPASAFSYSGSAVSGVDFTPIASTTLDAGALTATLTIGPLSNGVPPIDVANPQYSGNKSALVTLAGTSDFAVSPTGNTATLTLIDNATPAAAVLFNDPLTDAGDASNWMITYGGGDMVNHGDDYNVEFGYDLTANNPEAGNNGLIGLPPSGATSALRITCNKNDPSWTDAGGVNVYYKNKAFSGDYAVRFNMNLIEGISTYSVEGVMFGINHNGGAHLGWQTNWWLGNGSYYTGTTGPFASDGIWYWVQAPPGGAGGFGYSEFQEYTGASALPNTGWQQLATASAMPNVFKRAVYSAPGGTTGGTPANNSPFAGSPADNNWSDVEIKQVKGIVTMSINKTPIFTYTNTTTFTNGYLMLGYNAPIAGAYYQYVDSTDAAAYFSNLRVVSLTVPVITRITSTPSGANNNLTITFTTNDGGDSNTSFALQSASSVAGPYSDVGSAAFTQVPTTDGTAVFQATVTSSSGAQFYRIRHK